MSNFIATIMGFIFDVCDWIADHFECDEHDPY